MIRYYRAGVLYAKNARAQNGTYARGFGDLTKLNGFAFTLPTFKHVFDEAETQIGKTADAIVFGLKNCSRRDMSPCCYSRIFLENIKRQFSGHF
jgi:hypothetical protein